MSINSTKYLASENGFEETADMESVGTLHLPIMGFASEYVIFSAAEL